MRFIRVGTVAGRYGAKQRAASSDVLYEAVLGIGAPEKDRFEVFGRPDHHDHGPFVAIPYAPSCRRCGGGPAASGRPGVSSQLRTPPSL
jgi:hypothetical protein